MIAIKKFKKLFPISYEHYKLMIINTRYIDMYTECLTADFYNKYSDYNFAKDITKDNLKAYLSKLCRNYRNNIESPSELRIILIDKIYNIIIGGCTVIYDDSYKNLIISYFVIPEEQHKGIAINMLKQLLTAINKKSIYFENVLANIQVNNTNSIRLVKRLGFTEHKKYKGMYSDAIEYILNRRDIDGVR